ncbi:MAG: Tetratricopeptide repeat protein [Candidatus Poribacteria bacterium]|nr:Tetratricopeptide repeat protein [Candidatus Poribacteria bacterium]
MKPTLKIIQFANLLLIIFIIAGCATNLTTYNRGDVYMKRGDYDKAIGEFKQVLERTPNDPVTLSSIGIAYYAKGDYDQAINYLEQAKKADPRYIDAYFYLGMAYEQQGKYQEAMSEYDNCIALKPDNSVVKKLDKRRTFLSREIAIDSARKALQNEIALTSSINTIPDNTVAVTDFTNVGQTKEFDLLGKGLSAMLMTDLSKARALTVVERMKLESLFSEMKLEGVDSNTAARPGLLLGASKIVTGSFLSLDGKSIDIVSSLTMTKTKTSRPSKSVSGGVEKLFEIEKELALGILDDMGIILTEAERNAIIKRVPTRSFDAFMAYSRGLYYEDKGMYKEAAQEYEKAISIDPNFIEPRDGLKNVGDLMTETKNLASMENMRNEVALQSQQELRISEADANATRGLISTPSSAVINPRGGGVSGLTPTIKTVEVEVIFP